MLKVAYRYACMDAEASIEVRYRRPGEDAVEFMQEVVQPALGLDHARRSPICAAKATEYAKIEAPENAPFLFGEPKLNG